MNTIRLLLSPLLLALAVGAVQAGSLTSSAASSASKTVGSLSDSITGSSQSSGDGRVAAAGAYRVTALARLDGERVQLQLAPAAGQAQGFALTLPATVAAQQGLQAGAALWVAERPWGLAFAAQDGAAPFFLAVDDSLRSDFESRKL